LIKEDVEAKKNDVIAIKDLENQLGDSGTTTKKQDELVKKQITLLMRDLANDPALDPPTVTKRSLAAQGMNPRLIDEELKLKKIYMEVCDGKPVDIKKLKAELDAVMEELEEDIILEEKEESMLQDAEQELKDVDMLKNFEKTLATDGETTPEQNKELMREITQIMRDLAKDPKLDPATVTKRSLRA
jgi:Txe/YoeB family toxin of Txe-Axe toxin-antitoxin module